MLASSFVLNHLAYSVAAQCDAGRYNCSFTLSTNVGRQTFTESIDVDGRSLLTLVAG